MNRASDNENFINGKYCDNRIHSLSRCQSLNLFLFTLGDAFAKTPVDTMTLRLPSESKIEMSMANNSHAEILIVDDDALSRKILAQVLTSAGYNCQVCGDGAEALEMIHAKPPSLLLLDFDMPGANGAEVLKQLRSDQQQAVAQVPAIMLTAHGSEQSEVSCLQAGADDFVTKPVNTAVLRARIETQLRLRSMRRQLERQNDELERWRQDLERDLAAARLTQQSLIPQKPLVLPGWDVAACYRPVIQVGGDIYGWLRMKDGRILFWIADGSGHGAAAALLTTLAKLLFHHGSVEHNAPASVMEAVNDDFRSIFGGRSFMTAMCVALNDKTGRAHAVGAGHPPLLIVRHNGATESIPSVAPPLGLVEHTEFVETALDFGPGDAFLLYTDGLFGSSENGRHGITPQHLEKMLDYSAPTAEVLLRRILERVTPNNPEDSLSDDLTALAVRRMARQ